MSPPLSCFLTLKYCLLHIIPTLDSSLSSGPHSLAFVPDFATWLSQCSLFSLSLGYCVMRLPGDLAHPVWTVEGRTPSLPACFRYVI